MSILRHLGNLKYINIQNYYQFESLFWIDKLNYGQLFKIGIKNRFINKNGAVEYVNICVSNNKLFRPNHEIGIIEANKTIFSIINPLNYDVNVIERESDICLFRLNSDPENTDNHLCMIETNKL